MMDDLAERLKTWMRDTGFPLEMEAAHAFRKAGFQVKQSSLFPDPQTGDGREIDVLVDDQDLIGIMNISFVIECKATKNGATRPWIVLRSEDALASFNRALAFSIASPGAHTALIEAALSDGMVSRRYLRADAGGYGFRQAFIDTQSGNDKKVGKDSLDRGYGAAMSVLKACHRIVFNGESLKTFDFAFPVIVVDAPLFECALDSNGALSLSRVEQSEFLFSAYIPKQVSTCITVVTKDALPTFAANAWVLTKALREEFGNSASAYFAEHQL